MTRLIEPRSRVAALRAIALTGLAVAAAVITWRLRPSADLATTSPDSAVVAGCAWLAWLLAGYLAIATAATALSRLLGRLGRVGQVLGRVAPHQLRRLVDAAVTTTVAATIVSTAAATPATAAPRPAVVSERAPLVAGSPLDWPGLTSAAPVHHRPRHREPAPQPPPQHRPHVDVGAGGGDRSIDRDGVVVQPGDTLWRIAARQLGPGASGAAITSAWHAWYEANRAVIGSNPSVIRPGQHLQAPAARPAR